MSAVLPLETRAEAPRPRPTTHLAALTGLRFFAALWVVALHAFEARLDTLPGPVRNLVGSGWTAVNLFFVLSGFILAITYGRSATMDRAAFWVARAARVYPVYLLALALALPSFVAAMIRAHGGGLPLGDITGVGSLVVALLQSWFPRDVACVWNCPGWSLSDEAFFYLVFPLALAWLVARGRRALLLCAAAFWGASWLAVWLWMAATRGVSRELEYMVNYVPIVRLPEFLLGVSVGLWYLRTERPRTLPALAEVAFGGALALSLVGWPSGIAAYRTQVLTPLFAALILALAYGGGPLAPLLASRPIVRLGEASYALYLLHVPVHSWMWAADRFVGPGWSDRPWFTFLYFAVSIVASIVVYQWVEEPSRRRIRDRFAARRAAPPLAGVPARESRP